jgi:hypothetical protein
MHQLIHFIIVVLQWTGYMQAVINFPHTILTARKLLGYCMAHLSTTSMKAKGVIHWITQFYIRK